LVKLIVSYSGEKLIVAFYLLCVIKVHPTSKLADEQVGRAAFLEIVIL
jgi:hypothetical protein